MKWYNCKEKLPKTCVHVLVLRDISIDDFKISTYDIGMYIESEGRWKLNSQDFSPLPLKPTVDSGIVTHWMNLPRKPKE